MDKSFIDASTLIKMFARSAVQLSENKERVDALNVFPVPDGDTGTNMSLTMNQAIESIGKLDNPSITDLVKTMSKGCLMGARGNSGVILSQIFRGFANSLIGKEKIYVKDFSDALMLSQHTAYKAVLKPVEGTILTVIREISEYSTNFVDDSVSFKIFFEGLMERGIKSLSNTPNLLKPLKEAGVVDSGGMGLLYIFNGFYEVIHGKAVDLSFFHENVEFNKEFTPQSTVDHESIEFGYCTEFILSADKPEELGLKPYIMSMGDSVVYVTDENLLKVHLHTNEPGEVLTKVLKYGELVKVKIENMREQHSELIEGSHSHDHKHEYEDKFTENESVHSHKKKTEYSEYGFVAVGAGSGMKKILESLGVNIVISGGQTMNPSTKDIHEAIEKLNSKYVFVFPNNSNIILAANQAAELSESQVHVIPTKTIPQCIACLLVFNETADVEQNVEQFEEEIKLVSTLQITYAVRDTVIENMEISKGNYLAILDGKIVDTDMDINSTVLNSIDKAVSEDTEIITLYSGEDVSDEDAEKLSELIEEKYPDIEVELSRGDQPVYYYVISLE